MRLAIATLLLSTAALAQTPTGPAAEAQRSYAALKPNILKAADRMPAADYGNKPTPEIRTFARVVNHITEAQFRSCGDNFLITSFLADHSEFVWQKPILNDMKAGHWTDFSTAEPNPSLTTTNR